MDWDWGTVLQDCNQNQTRTRTGAGASLGFGLGLGLGLGYGRQTVEADGTVDGGARSDRIKIWAIPTTTRQEK